MKSFARQSVLVFCGLIVGNVLTYVYYATVTRSVGVDAAGLFMSLVSAIMIAALPAVIGGNVIAKMAADASSRSELGVVAGLGVAVSLLVLPSAIVVGVAVAIGLPIVERFFHAADAMTVLLAAGALALTVVTVLQRSVLQGAGRFGSFVGSNVVESGVKAGAGLLTWTMHGGLRIAMGGYVVATAAAAAFSATRWIGGPKAVLPAVPARIVVRHLVGIALPAAALTGVSLADVVLVRHSLDAYESGLYAASALFGRAVLGSLQFVPAVLMPRVVSERAAGNSAAPLLFAALAVTAAASTIAALAAALVPDRLLNVVAGHAFVAASPLLLPYTAAMAALAGAAVLVAYLIAVEKTGFAIPLVAVAVMEVAAIAVFHPSAAAVVRVVLVGHCALIACCIPDVVLSLNRGNASARSEGPRT
jgi:O-antigen/teichoic acid export membrane protein